MTAAQIPEERPLAMAGVGLRELETFVAVAELGSFSLAAKRLNLSQPAVTARVQKLEVLLGTRLLHRTTRTVEVTAAGRRLAGEAVRALHDLRALIAEFLNASAETRRRIVVAATPMIAAVLLPRPVQQYRERRPDVQIVVLDVRSAIALEALERGECDIAIMALDRPQPRYRFQLLMEAELVVVLPPAHPLAAAGTVTLEALVRYPVMMLEQYATHQAEIEAACERQGLRFQPGYRAGNLPTLLGMLDAGSGITLLPRTMAQHNAARPRTIVSIEGSDMKRRYGILSQKGQEMSAVTRQFCDFLKKALTPEAGIPAPPPAGVAPRHHAQGR